MGTIRSEEFTAVRGVRRGWWRETVMYLCLYCTCTAGELRSGAGGVEPTTAPTTGPTATPPDAGGEDAGRDRDACPAAGGHTGGRGSGVNTGTALRSIEKAYDEYSRGIEEVWVKENDLNLQAVHGRNFTAAAKTSRVIDGALKNFIGNSRGRRLGAGHRGFVGWFLRVHSFPADQGAVS